MQPKILLAIAAAAALLSACDRGTSQPAKQGSPSSGASQVQSSATPSTAGAATPDEKREGANPQQGQVDPKEREQRRDFQQSGDAKGPSSADTTPRN